jgi:periplasmic divalent cation tolerance protein
MNTKFFVVLITVPNLAEGEKMAQRLVEEKLAACVNLFPEIKSFYWWKGKIEKSPEVFLVVKTIESQLEALKKSVKAMHSYSVPEIIALPIVEGFPPYLSWIQESLTLPKKTKKIRLSAFQAKAKKLAKAKPVLNKNKKMFSRKQKD